MLNRVPDPSTPSPPLTLAKTIFDIPYGAVLHQASAHEF